MAYNPIIQESITTDTYGNSLLNRLSDLYFCIHSGAEDMVYAMVNLPKVSEQGFLEIEIIMAAILSNRVEKGIVLQSLLLGNPAFHKVGLTNISNAMEGYLHQHKLVIWADNIRERHSLLEFVKNNGELKLAHLKEPDASGNKTAPLFIDDNTNRSILCRFVFFAENEQNADFIKRNKSDIVIDETVDGEYLFRHKRDLDWAFDFYMKQIAYYIYCSPLQYKFVLCEAEVEKGLANIKRRPTNAIVLNKVEPLSKSDFEESSDICPDIGYALDAGVGTMEEMAISTCIVELGFTSRKPSL